MVDCRDKSAVASRNDFGSVEFKNRNLRLDSPMDVVGSSFLNGVLTICNRDSTLFLLSTVLLAVISRDNVS